jgi:hypothetical protein
MKVIARNHGAFILVATALALAVMAGACNRKSEGSYDQHIVTSIEAELFRNPDLKTLSVNVTSKQGVVTLSGTVNAPVQKLAVEDLARKTAGVKQVLDDLSVAPASGQNGASSASAEQVEGKPRRQHHPWRSFTGGSPAQTPPANEEAQSASEPAPDESAQAQDNNQPAPDSPAPVQDTSQPAPDNSAQAPDGSQPTGPDGSAPGSAPAATPRAATAAPPPASQQVTIPAGTVVSVRMIHGISSGTAQPGQVYKASLSVPVSLHNEVVIPRDASARVRVVEVQSAGHYRGRPLLKLELAGFTVNGTQYLARSDYYTKVGESQGKNTAEKVGGGAGLGALLGGLIGHGKGAGIGAIIGAGAGTIDQRATRAREVRIPSEARIDFTLSRSVGVAVGGGQ